MTAKIISISSLLVAAALTGCASHPEPVYSGGNATAQGEPLKSRTKIDIDGWTYIIHRKGNKVRVDQGTFWTRDKIEVVSRAKRALRQSFPDCAITEEHWQGIALEAYIDCSGQQSALDAKGAAQ